MPSPHSDPTREGALDLLSAVLVRHRSLEDALHALPPGEARDRAAAHRLAAPERMGRLFKVLGMCHPSMGTLPGFGMKEAS